MSLPISAAVTHNARCARSLLNVLHKSLQKEHTKTSSPDPILLFVLAPSSTSPPEVLSDITSTLTQFYPAHVGCISATLPCQYFNSSIRGSHGPHSCSLAYALVNGVSFRSTILGRAQAQVGRWHAARQRTEYANGAMRVNVEDQMRIISDFSDSDGKVHWEDVWDRTANSVTSSPNHGNRQGSESLPDALKHLEYVFSVFTTFLCKCYVRQPIGHT